jgi:hypothetical protein
MSTTCTVTATICDPSQTNLLGNAFVRFRLRNFQGFVPTVQTSNVFCETQIDALPNPAGVISQVLTCNTAIYPINTFYTVEFWNQGRPTSSGNYYFNGNTSLNTAATINPAPAPQGAQSIVLENNGALNSSQTTLNLESTDSSVAITDVGGGTLNLKSSSISYATPGQGGFVGAGFPFPFAFYAGTTLSGSVMGTSMNQLTVFQFQPLVTFTISKVSARVVTGAANSNVNFGIYDVNGNKLLDSGAISTASSAVNISATFASPVKLSAGSTYYFAQSSDHTSNTIVAFTNGLPGSANIINLNATRVGQAANGTVAGVMPATLGTITADTLFIDCAAAFFEV